MIPGTIEEWKKALNDSPQNSIERGACVYAIASMGEPLQYLDGSDWIDCKGGFNAFEFTYRVKSTPRPWNNEDARKHVGFAWRKSSIMACGIIGHNAGSLKAWGAECGPWDEWSGAEYAEPKWGTDPSTWNWQKCEVVE